MSSVSWDFTPLSSEQELIKREIGRICEEFDAEYWREHDKRKEYPHEFADLLGENGWLGALIPEEYGGGGMTTAEMVVMMEEIAAQGGGFGATQAIHGAIYTTRPLVEHGGKRVKEEILPKLATGEETIQSLGLTEPNAGSESTAIETEAVKDGDEYVVNGQKIWTSRLDVSDYLLLVARTKPKAEVDKKTDGISMLLVDVEDAKSQDALEMKSIDKTSTNLSGAFEVWLEDLRVPAENIIGEEHKGFYSLLDGLNDERLVIAAELIGMAELALAKGAEYASERIVFDQAIGANQSIQHPLAAAHADVQAARQLTYEAAERSAAGDLSREALGARANAAKYLAAEAAFDAADAAVQAHGGKGIATEYDVERYFREARLSRLVPVTQQLALNYLGERELGLPRSY